MAALTAFLKPLACLPRLPSPSPCPAPSSLALVLECVRASSGGRPIELLRKESLAAMPPSQAFRILSHSYSAVLPITSLAFPPLPLSNTRAVSPVNYGPTPAAQTPWLHLALYSAVGAGPRSLVLAAGQQLRRLPGELLLAAGGATHALLWPFDAGAVRAQVRRCRVGYQERPPARLRLPACLPT